MLFYSAAHGGSGLGRRTKLQMAAVLPVARKLLKCHFSQVSLHSSSFREKENSVHPLSSPLAFFMPTLGEKCWSQFSLVNFMQSSRSHLYLGDHGPHGSLAKEIYTDWSWEWRDCHFSNFFSKTLSPF